MTAARERGLTQNRRRRDHFSPPQTPRRVRGTVAYTRFVALMRRLLPGAALVLLVLVVAWPQLLPDERVQVGYSDTRLKGLGRNAVVMANPRYYGVDSQERPYSVVADIARQTEAEKAVNLEQPRADMLLKDGSGVLLDARTGIYRQDTQHLLLQGDVNLYHDKGYELHTQSARVDLAAGTAEGSEPISGHGPSIELEGAGFRLTDRGRTIFLTGKSHLVLYPRRKE